jgi:hypothetical protein
MFSAASRDSPGPVSVTLTIAWPDRTAASIATRPSGAPAFASHALRNRLIMTCWIWMRSASTISSSRVRSSIVPAGAAPGADQPHAFGDRGLQVEQRLRGLAPPRQLAHVADDVACALRRFLDAAQRLGQRDRVPAVGVHQPDARPGIVGDRGERLVQFMAPRSPPSCPSR